MAKLKRVKGLELNLKEIRKRRAQALKDDKTTTSMGYSAPYALVQHERLDFQHRVGQAKYLEQPIRTERKEVTRIITTKLKAKVRIKQAQLSAMHHIKRISLTLVPVDTGRLRNSWFIT